MINRIRRFFLMITGVIVISGCGTFYHAEFLSHDLNHHHLYGPSYYRFIPERNNIYYNAPRNHLNQNINNSININSNLHREIDVTKSRVYFVDDGNYGVPNAIDGTLNQVVVEERQRVKIPLCHSVVQSVQALNYNSFQYTNCN